MDSASSPRDKSNDPLETAKWTNWLPQTFGIRDAVKQSSYRWCVREGGMWSLATASAMSLHRLRMGSRPVVCGHVFFFSAVGVLVPSYWFCFKQREYKEAVIEAMMNLNKFGHAKELREPALEEHPFWQPATAVSDEHHDREFRGMIKERKEWQQPVDQSLEDIFKEK